MQPSNIAPSRHILLRRRFRAFAVLLVVAGAAFLAGQWHESRLSLPKTEGLPVLHAAVARDDHPAVARLLEERANLQSTDEEGNTPLHHARSMEMVDRLLSAGALRDARNLQQETPLHIASTADAARGLLAAGADPKALDDSKETPLHDAHNEQLVVLLAEAGADLNAKDRDGRTPLHAATSGRVVKALLKMGADPSLVDSRDLSPLHMARDAEAVKALVKAGISVSTRDANGRAPLHTVANASAAAQLLRMGAERDAPDKLGRTPFDANERAEVAEVLLDAGADINAGVPDTPSKLARALLHHRTEMAHLLLVRGADLPTPNYWSQSLSPTVIRALLARGASPRTLRLAGVNDLDLVEKLIARGAQLQPNAASLGSPLGEAPTPEIAKAILDAMPSAKYSGQGLRVVLHRYDGHQMKGGTLTHLSIFLCSLMWA